MTDKFEVDIIELSKIKGEKETQIAKNLLKLNVEIDTILETTGLTKEEIEKLK